MEVKKRGDEVGKIEERRSTGLFGKMTPQKKREFQLVRMLKMTQHSTAQQGGSGRNAFCPTHSLIWSRVIKLAPVF